MRIAFIGAGSAAIMTVRTLIDRGHEVVIIERDKERIEELADHLDCGFLHGDGTRPDVLREVDPPDVGLLYCLTANDQANIIASLVGRSLGFKRVVTKVEDPEFEHIAVELGLENIIVPARTIGRYMADMVEGQDILELSSMIKGEARIFSFVVQEDAVGPVSEMGLPAEARVVCFYRDEAFSLTDGDTKLKKGDEVVVITHRKHLTDLRDRFLGDNHTNNDEKADA